MPSKPRLYRKYTSLEETYEEFLKLGIKPFEFLFRPGTVVIRPFDPERASKRRKDFQKNHREIDSDSSVDLDPSQNPPNPELIQFLKEQIESLRGRVNLLEEQVAQRDLEAQAHIGELDAMSAQLAAQKEESASMSTQLTSTEQKSQHLQVKLHKSEAVTRGW